MNRPSNHDSRPRCYIVLLNWHGASDTTACLDSLLRLQGCDFQLVVCENGSTDDSVSRIRSWALDRPGLRMIEYTRERAESGGMDAECADVFMLHTGANLGFAGGCNVGIRFALARGDADFVWLLNNDTEVEPRALAALLDRAVQDDRPGLVGSLLCYFDARDRIQSLGGGTFDVWRCATRHIADGLPRASLTQLMASEAEADMAYVVGASMLVSREFLERVGLLQEDYFLYYEEMDWAERARRATPPLRFAFAPLSVVYHKVGATAGTRVHSLFALRCLNKSRIRFAKRFYAARLPIVRLHVVWEAWKALLLGRVAEARLKLGLAFSSVRL